MEPEVLGDCTSTVLPPPSDPPPRDPEIPHLEESSGSWKALCDSIVPTVRPGPRR